MALKRLFRFLLPRALFLLASVILILVAKGWKFDFAERTFILTGILQIDTAPNGAEILLNGESRGTTPAIINNVHPGRYELSLTKRGFHPWQKTITMLPEMVNDQAEIVLFPTEPQRETVVESSLALDLSPTGDFFIRYSAVESQIVATLFNNKGIQTGVFRLPITGQDLVHRLLTWAPDQSTLVISLRDAANRFYLESYLIDFKSSPLAARVLNAEDNYPVAADRTFSPIFINNSELLVRDETGSIWAYDFRDDQSTDLESTLSAMIPLFVADMGFFAGQRLYGLAPTTAANAYQLTQVTLDNGEVLVVSDGFTLRNTATVNVAPDRKTAILADEVHGAVLTQLDDEIPELQFFERPIGRSYGWTADSQLFLFASTDQELTYFDLAKKAFLLPLALTETSTIEAACWHPNNAYIFFTTSDGTEEPRQTLQVIERDGRNQIALLESDDILGIHPSAPLLCANPESLLFGNHTASGEDRLDRLYIQ